VERTHSNSFSKVIDHQFLWLGTTGMFNKEEELTFLPKKETLKEWVKCPGRIKWVTNSTW